MRVHELAKELGLESKELAQKLIAMKIDVKSHMSAMTDEQVKKARQGLKGIPLPPKGAQPKAEAKKKPKKKEEEKPPEQERVILVKKQPAPPPVAEEPKKPEIKKMAPVAEKPAAKTSAAPKHPPAKAAPVSTPASVPAAAAKTATTTIEPEAPKEKKEEKILEINFPATVKDLAEKLELKPNVLISKLMGYGVFATINQNLDEDTATIVAHEFGYALKANWAAAPEKGTAAAAAAVKEKEIPAVPEPVLAQEPPDKPADLGPRAPVVTILGHVDHGKTSLLDKIRTAKVAASESGGITQHIGAYSVNHKDHIITFLDTPGHEAFTAMRARGARVTDIAILVIAADDGIMPQTLEALDHARAANVPIIVAINKIDLPTAAPDRIKRQLSEHNLLTEDWGGETICVGVSAKSGQGIDQLLEMILLQAEVLELKANPKRRASGTVVEAKLSSGRGSVATVLVRNGTLRVGDPIVAGLYSGKVKALQNDRGQMVREAGPSTPVEVIGLNGVPDAGSDFYAAASEKEAKIYSEQRQQLQRDRTLGTREKVTLEDIYKQIASGKVKSLNLIIKTDVQGSLEALQKTIQGIPSEKISVRIIHAGTGDISESDVMLATASKAVIVGFHVKSDVKVKELARKEEVDIRTYEIIYQVVEDIRKAMEGLLEPTFSEVVLGRAKVRQCFKISKVGMVAGCYVTEGVIRRNAKVRLLRGEEVVYTGEVSSLKRFKDEVKEVKSDFECGLRLLNFDDIRENDILECFTLQKEEQKL